MGVDKWNVWNLPALNTLIENTNVAPTKRPEQKNTTAPWNKAPSMPVPQAVKLTPADVGPLGTR